MRRARASLRMRLAQLRSAAEICEPATRLRATTNDMRGFIASIQGRNVSQASAGCSVRCARAQTESPWGAIVSSRTGPMRRVRRKTMGFSAACTSLSANPKASTAMTTFFGSSWVRSSPSIFWPTRVNVAASRANQPVVSDDGAWGSIPSSGKRP